MLSSLDTLREQSASCSLCSISKDRRNVVFGSIPYKSVGVALVGEAPGEQEDYSGEPFCGKSGQLLRRILLDVGLDPNSILIANCIMCRPPKNRPPSQEELCNCKPWLSRKLEIFNPRVVITAGKYATASILGVDPKTIKITTMVGNPFSVEGKYTVVPIVHPSFVIRGGKTERDYAIDIARGVYNALPEVS